SPMLQHWECVTKDQPSPGGTADLEPGAFDWRRPQPSLRDSDACDWPPHPNTEVLGYCHVSLRDIRIGCGALTFLSATELREAFGVCGACSRFRIACALRQRQQAGRTPNASRQAFSMRLRDSTFVLPRRWDCVCTELQHQETHERGYDQGQKCRIRSRETLRLQASGGGATQRSAARASRPGCPVC